MNATSLVSQISARLPDTDRDSLLRYSRQLLRGLGAPLLGLALFLLLWQFAAQKVDTSLGKFPGPLAVAEQAANLYDEHAAERDKAAALEREIHFLTLDCCKPRLNLSILLVDSLKGFCYDLAPISCPLNSVGENSYSSNHPHETPCAIFVYFPLCRCGKADERMIG